MPSTTTPRAINGFNGRYRFLSNFWETPAPTLVRLVEDDYAPMYAITAEHLYQAAKIGPSTGHDWETREAILRAGTAPLAKKAGQLIGKVNDITKIRHGWDGMRLSVMEQIVRAKFTQHANLKQMLLDTGQAYIEETNYWGDKFWGVCKGFGENHLGKILMKVRDEIRQAG